MKGCLTDGGLVAMNVSAARDDAPLLTGICATLQTVFPHVYRMRIPGSERQRRGRLGSRPRLPAAGRHLRRAMGPLAAAGRQGFREVAVVAAGTRPLTDDWAPVEHMVDWELLARRARP